MKYGQGNQGSACVWISLQNVNRPLTLCPFPFYLDDACNVADGRSLRDRLLLLSWKAGLLPILPTPLQGVDLRVTVAFEFLCHTGTGVLIASGAVEDQCLVLWVFLDPTLDDLRILSHGPLDLGRAFRPRTFGADVHDDHFRVTEPSFELFFRHLGRVI